MKSKLFASMLLLVAAMQPGAALADEPGRFGIGLIVGDPSGVSGKHNLGRMAIDWAVGWGLIEGDGIQGHVDWLWSLDLKSFDRADLGLHFGVGPKLALFDDAAWVGARAPVGVNFAFERVPIDVFVEVAAGLWIVEETDFDLDAAAGARWWF